MTKPTAALLAWLCLLCTPLCWALLFRALPAVCTQGQRLRVGPLRPSSSEGAFAVGPRHAREHHRIRNAGHFRARIAVVVFLSPLALTGLPCVLPRPSAGALSEQNYVSTPARTVIWQDAPNARFTSLARVFRAARCRGRSTTEPKCILRVHSLLGMPETLYNCMNCKYSNQQGGNQ